MKIHDTILRWQIGFALLCLGAGLLRADSIVSKEAIPSRYISGVIDDYAYKHNGELPQNWDDLIIWRQWYADTASPLAVGQGVSEAYSFVAQEDRKKFPLGDLILVAYAPVDWPKSLSPDFSGVDLSQLSDELRKRFEENVALTRSMERAVRYLVYKDNKTNNVASQRWYEDDFQAMLKETGITIPRPTPYYPKGPDGEYLPLTPQAIEALVRLDLTDTIPPELAAQMRATGTLPAPRPPRPAGTSDAASPAASPTTLAQITSTPWLGWAAALVVLIAAALYLRRQHAKRG